MKKTFAAFVAVQRSRVRWPRRRRARSATSAQLWLVESSVARSSVRSRRQRPAYGGPVYVEDAPPPPGGCYWQRQRFWDGYEWRFRRIQVCN